MPKEHDKYKCANEVLKTYWELIEEFGFEPELEDFKNGEALKLAISIMADSEEKED